MGEPTVRQSLLDSLSVPRSERTLPGTFRSAIQLTQPGSTSVRTTIPEGVAKAIDAEPGGTLVWTVDLKAGRVTVAAEGSGVADSAPVKSS